MAVYSDKPVIGLIDLAARCLLDTDNPVAAGAMRHCADALRKINRARHDVMAAQNTTQRERAVSELLDQLYCLGPKHL